MNDDTKAHSELGASVCARWMACPGSVRLARSVPAAATTPYAAEGTAAHAHAEYALRNRVPVSSLDIADDMREAVSMFVDYCQGLSATEWWVERPISLAALNPPGAMFGTADYVAYSGALRALEVVDFKYGQGVVVEAKGNKQLRYYALGALLSLPKGTVVDTIAMTIVQPRAEHADGPIRSETVPVEEIVAFANELLDAARLALGPAAPFRAGAHCRFCPAAGICPAQLAAAQTVAMVEFADMPLEKPQDPATLTPVQLSNLLHLLPLVEDWAAAVRAHAQGKLERGEELPGYKLVAKRAVRKWTGEGEAGLVERVLRRTYTPEEYNVEPALKSPAQIEKLLGKKAFDAALSQYVEKKPSGVTLARAADPRPAVVLTAGDDFTALPPGGDNA